MPELDHHDIALLEILLHFVQAAFLHKRLGTATADSVVHNLDAGTVKETTQNLPPARLRVGIVLVVTDRGVATLKLVESLTATPVNTAAARRNFKTFFITISRSFDALRLLLRT